MEPILRAYMVVIAYQLENSWIDMSMFFGGLLSAITDAPPVSSMQRSLNNYVCVIMTGLLWLPHLRAIRRAISV